jgi:branched-chain amino acid aminotransferase
MTAQPQRPAFGTVLASHMAVATYQGGRWSASELKPVAPIELSPAAHVLHYASTCFEGFKAFRRADGSVHVFRMDRHIQRMRQSARQLVLPEPDAAQLADMVRSVINRCRDAVPEAPGALYLRPLLVGTTANIGAAATPTADASLIVLASPVWDYFSGGMKPLRILVDDENTRSAAQMGMVKTGGNYAAALGPTLSARAKYQADQVSERIFDVKEMLEWVKTGEAALSGTAAVLAGVGTLIYRGAEHRVASGEVGPLTRSLRTQLVAIQQGDALDRHRWLERV